jgi:glycosyltransferase involved in cell wall biosynthesis
MGRVVAIAEQMWVGHYETQMKLFVQILLKRGCRVLVLCPRPETMDCWLDEVLPEYRDKFYASFFPPEKDKSSLRKILLWRSLRNHIRSAEMNTGWSVDIVLLPWLDGLFPDKRWQSPFVRYFMTFPWVGLYFLPSIFRRDVPIPWRSRKRKIMRQCGLFKSKNCFGVGILDEGSYDGLSQRIGEKPVILVPDVTDEQLPVSAGNSVLKIRQKAGGRPIIGLIGVLSPRKGVLNFLRLVASLDPEQCYFLMAGQLMAEGYLPAEQEELKRLLDLGKNENCTFILEYIADAAMVNSLVNVSDILYLAYEKFYHSSGLLTKAAVFKKPVIASKEYCMGKKVEEYKLGITVTEGNLVEISEAVKYLIDADKRKTLVENAEFDLYHDLNNLPKLEEALCKMLQL